jgi:tetratricopeptide (TPR) repeat protein
MMAALPRYSLPFIGRQDALAQMTELLTAGRVLTLLGLGGVGKTRLSVTFAERWSGTVRFVDLQSAEDAADVRLQVAQAIGAQLREPIAPRIQAMSRPLLVLDNLEQVSVEAAPLIQAWNEEAPNAAFLVTSRRPLDLDCEHRLSIHPFPVPEQVTDLASLEAARIFIAAAPPQTPISAELLGVLAELDGLPLALQLAAARLEMMTLSQLASQLRQRRFALLRRPERREYRHDSLWSTIGWSWQQLSDEHRDVLRQCAIFEGRFTLEDAEQVIGGGSFDQIDVLHALCRHQLLSFDGRRFALLVSIRAFLRDQGDPDDALVARHTAWCLNRARGHYDNLTTVMVIPALDGLSALFADLRVLVRGAGEAAWEAMVYLIGLLGTRGDRRERLRMLEGVLSRSDSSPHRAWLISVQAGWERLEGHEERAMALLEQVLSDPDCTPDARAFAMLKKGNLLIQQGKLRDAAILYQKAQSIAKKPHIKCSLMANYAMTIHDLGDLSLARQLGREAAAYGREQGLHGPRAGALNQLGTILLEQDRMVEAAVVLREALGIYQGSDTRKCGFITGQFALILELDGQLEAAVTQYTEAIALLGSVGERRLKGNYQWCVGRIQLLQGHLDEAAEGLACPSASKEAHVWRAAERAWAGDVDAVEVLLLQPTQDIYQPVLPLIRQAARLQADPLAHRGALEAMVEADDESITDGDARQRQRLCELLSNIAEEARLTWVIAKDGAWFAPPGGLQVSLTRRPIHARFLAAMLAAHQAAPGSRISAAVLQEIGWPGEVMLASAAANRIRVALSGLRKAGLSPLMKRSAAGWGLDEAGFVRAVVGAVGS